MTTPAQIITQLETQLQDSADLSYVKNVMIGERESVTNFPVIFIEPLRNDEKDRNFQDADLMIEVALIGYISTREADKQIVGAGNTKGITDLENDIKKAISADRQLNTLAVDTRIKSTVYGRPENAARRLLMTIEVDFRQTATERA